MAKLLPAELRDLLVRDLPGVLVSTEPSTPPVPAPPSHKLAPADLLATSDAVIQPERLADAAGYLRDILGYRLLTNITAVDMVRENLIELVYHFVHIEGGVLVLKTRVPRDEPKLPTLTHEWPGADFQEREAYDLFGVVFIGHTDLRRIYMWDEFDGFPMRKDFPKQGDKYFADGE